MAETFSVRMPDGTVVDNIPVGTPKAEIMRRYERSKAFEQTKANYSTSDKLASNFTGGLSDKVGALGQALGGEIAERFGGRAAPFRERYSDALAATDAAEADWNARNPAGRVAAAPLALMAGGPATGFGRAALARQGVTLGTVSGAGQSRGTFGQQAAQTAFSAGAGAILAPAAGAVANRVGGALANRAPSAGQRTRAAVAQAAEQEGIRLMPADVGGPMARRITAGLDQSPLASPSIRAGAQASLDSAQQAISNRAGQMGTVLDDTGLGTRLQEGARNYMSRTSGTGGKLYDRAERLAGNATVTPIKAVQALDDNLAQLGQNPNTNKAAIDALTQIRDDLAQPGKPLQAVRDLRTQVRDAFANQGLRGNDLKRRVDGVMAALNDDIAASLSGNPAALAAYRRADKFWQQRVETIDDALVKILGRDGNVSAEQAAQRLSQLASPRGDSANLTAILRSLPKDARGDVSASVLDRLGRARAGAQSAAGDTFSPATFGTNWNNLTPQAKAALFPEPTHRQAIDRIATVVIDGMKESGRFANSSNTGSVTLQATNFAMFAFEPVWATLNVGGQLVGGKLMSNPSFARWLAPTLRAQNPAQLQARLQVLPRIAAANPAVQAEVNAFMRAANDNLARLAAEGNGGEEQQP